MKPPKQPKIKMSAGALRRLPCGFWVITPSDCRESAQLVPTPASDDVVTVGHRVTFVRSDNRRQEFRIVGEDEADPRSGSISYVAPVARALMGKAVGDIVAIGDQEIEIVAID
jgi:transcription elongation GreA/GreB family factor